MNKMWLVIKEVYRKNVMSASFIMMVLGPILMIGVIGMIAYFIGQTAEKESVGEIGIVGVSQAVETVLESNEIGNNYHYFDSKDEAESALSDEAVDGFIVFESAEVPLKATYYREKASKDIDVSKISTILQQYQTQESIKRLGVDANKLAAINAQTVDVASINLSFGNDGQVVEDAAFSDKKMIRTGVAYAVSFIVYLFIMTYMGIISQEIATEKGSRIMEIVLSSISSTKHFFGKMIGIFLVILTQVLIYVGLFFIGRFIFELSEFKDLLSNLPFDVQSVMSSAVQDIMLGCLFALFGILTYSSLAGFLGSLVSKIEDVNKVMTPLILMGLAGFYLGMFALSSTNNTVIRITSQIPFFTPFVMPFRVAAETVTSFEIIISVVISAIFMVACLAVSTVFYKSNVLVTSDKGIIQTLKRSVQLWQSERNSK